MPKISVIVPAYNAEKFINEAIDSILGQTFADFELIVINDCSVDRTKELICAYRDPRIRYVENERNMGVAATLNRGLELAQGEYIARMDADDISMPERFQKQVDYLDAHPDAGICGSCIEIFGEDTAPRVFPYSEDDAQIRVDMIFNSAFAHPAVMLRRSVLEEHQIRYDIAFEKAEDYRMWFAVLDVSRGHNLQEVLLHYRYHQKQVTKTHLEEQHHALSGLRKLSYDTLCVGTDALLDDFSRLCSGQRTFSEAEYSNIRQLMERSLQNNRNYDRKLLKKVWSLINYSIYTACRPGNFRPLSMLDRALLVRGKLGR